MGYDPQEYRGAVYAILVRPERRWVFGREMVTRKEAMEIWSEIRMEGVRLVRCGSYPFEYCTTEEEHKYPIIETLEAT